MIIIENSKSLTQPFKVRYTGKNNETLATSELLKSKKACWKNIHSMYKSLIHIFCDVFDGYIEVKDMTVQNPEVFLYDINGIKKKAGVRK